MAGKSKPKSGNKTTNDDRRCKKANKTHPGVAPGAHNGHSVGGYSIKKYGREEAERLAGFNTTPMRDRRAARRNRRGAKAA